MIAARGGTGAEGLGAALRTALTSEGAKKAKNEDGPPLTLSLELSIDDDVARLDLIMTAPDRSEPVWTHTLEGSASDPQALAVPAAAAVREFLSRPPNEAAAPAQP